MECGVGGGRSPEGATEDGGTRSAAGREILGAMKLRGAVFASDLQQQMRVGTGELNDALGELVSRGRIAADGFGGLRSLLQSWRLYTSPNPRDRQKAGLAASAVKT